LVTTEGKCPIWGVDCSFSQSNPFSRNIDLVKGSFRAGGDYEIAFPAHAALTNLDERAKARVTSVLVEQKLRGVDVPRLTEDDVIQATSRQELPPYERAERLLRLLANRSSQIGSLMELIRHSVALRNGLDRHSSALSQAAMAWSESITDEELEFLFSYLERMGWITVGRRIGVTYSDYGVLCRVEIPGYSRIEELETNPDASQCFVAMWFHESMDAAYEQGIRPAIEGAGYSPLRIDRLEFNGKIDDEIVAEIRRSRFLIADFTNGDDGARGGVYYEAGFAHGLGLDVIFACRGDVVEKLHFDTRQFNHIVWSNPESLRKQLSNRIGSVIGDGPNRMS
jgi:hypothetical protein